jgi:hypothetical protein
VFSDPPECVSPATFLASCSIAEPAIAVFAGAGDEFGLGLARAWRPVAQAPTSLADVLLLARCGDGGGPGSWRGAVSSRATFARTQTGIA